MAHAGYSLSLRIQIIFNIHEFQSSILEPVGFIDDQQLDQRRIAARHQKLALALVVLIGSLHQIGKRRKQRQHLFFNACDRGGNRRCIKDRATLLHGRVQRSGSEGQRSVRIQVVHRIASGEGDQGFGQERF